MIQDLKNDIVVRIVLIRERNEHKIKEAHQV
jgi:hypothetical protein